MPCSPNDNTLNPSILPPYPPIPGFGIPFAPPQIPFPDVSLPEGIPEDLLALMRDFLTNFPGGPFTPNLNNFSKDVLDAIASLLNVLAPFLGFYNFIQALLNMILCIMDILCAINNPFALIRAIKRLFKQCLPPFLNLFPWLALLAMIIALILLLLALIAYLIQQIIKLIEQIIANLTVLAEAIQLDDADSVESATRKIAYLLCLLEQLFAILIAFQAIMAIIEQLANLSGRKVCSSGNNSGCCDDDVCPPFIRNNPDGIPGTQGRLLYQREVFNDTSGFPTPVTLPSIRNERWQFVDEETGRTYNFSDIITPIDGNVYWPDGFSFASNTSLKKAPYLLDMTMEIDPAVFNHPDTEGQREFVIKDCIVTERPYIGLLDYNDVIIPPDTGTLMIEGGLVYEADGTTPYIVNGFQATLNTFIHLPSYDIVPPIPSDDGYNIYNISYNLRPNHPPLVEYSLITLGCVPEVSVESEIANLVASDISSVFSRIGALPNINGTIGCLQAGLATLRTNVSPANVAIFQATAVGCLNDLNSQTLDTYLNAVTAGTSVYTTTVDIDPTIQFVDENILVKVTLRDAGGTALSFRVPPDVQSSLGQNIEANVTLGNVGPFAFDGYESFTANLTSDAPGVGELRVSFNNEILSEVINRDNDEPTQIIERVISYRFVGISVSAAGDNLPANRRDDSDTARDE